MANANRILFLANNPVKDYVGRLSTGATRSGNAPGYSLFVENSFETGRAVNEVLDDPSLAGVILTPPYSDDRHVLLAIEARKLPYVRIAPLLDPERGSSVMMDEYEAARAITDVLLNAGHRRVAILRGPSSHLVSMRRYNGYAAALGGKAMRVDQTLVAQGDFSRESGRAQAAKLFSAKPTAIFSSNDDMAAGLIDAALDAGMRLPQDLSIVGFDDNALARTIRPRLTTVRQPLEEMGAAAMQLLAEAIRAPGRKSETRVIPFELMLRDSVVAPADVSTAG